MSDMKLPEGFASESSWGEQRIFNDLRQLGEHRVDDKKGVKAYTGALKHILQAVSWIREQAGKPRYTAEVMLGGRTFVINIKSAGKFLPKQIGHEGKEPQSLTHQLQAKAQAWYTIEGRKVALQTYIRAAISEAEYSKQRPSTQRALYELIEIASPEELNACIFADTRKDSADKTLLQLACRHGLTGVTWQLLNKFKTAGQMKLLSTSDGGTHRNALAFALSAPPYETFDEQWRYKKSTIMTQLFAAADKEQTRDLLLHKDDQGKAALMRFQEYTERVGLLNYKPLERQNFARPILRAAAEHLSLEELFAIGKNEKGRESRWIDLIVSHGDVDLIDKVVKKAGEDEEFKKYLPEALELARGYRNTEMAERIKLYISTGRQQLLQTCTTKAIQEVTQSGKCDRMTQKLLCDLIEIASPEELNTYLLSDSSLGEAGNPDKTLLSLACRHGLTAVVQRLIDKFQQAGDETFKKSIPELLEIARTHKHTAVVALLEPFVFIAFGDTGKEIYVTTDTGSPVPISLSSYDIGKTTVGDLCRAIEKKFGWPLGQASVTGNRGQNKDVYDDQQLLKSVVSSIDSFGVSRLRPQNKFVDEQMEAFTQTSQGYAVPESASTLDIVGLMQHTATQPLLQPLNTIAENALIARFKRDPEAVKEITSRPDLLKTLRPTLEKAGAVAKTVIPSAGATYEVRSYKKEDRGYQRDTTPFIKFMNSYGQENSFRTAMEDIADAKRALLSQVITDHKSLPVPNRQALEFHAKDYKQKYGDHVDIRVAHTGEFNALWKELQTTVRRPAYVGIIVGDEYTIDGGHVCPVLCYLGENGKNECMIMDVLGKKDIQGRKRKLPNEIGKKLEEELGVSKKKIFYSQGTRQADENSCRTGALILLSNAMLSLNDHKKKLQNKGFTETLFSTLKAKVNKEDPTLIDRLPSEWTYFEQLYEKREEREEGIAVRSVHSQDPAKRKRLTTKQYRETQVKPVKIKYEFTFYDDFSERFIGVQIPEGVKFTFDKAGKRTIVEYTLDANINLYLYNKAFANQARLVAYQQENS